MSLLQAVLPSHAEIRQRNVSSVGDIPLVVIRHGRLQPMMNEELTAVVEETNQRLQAAVAAQSPRGQLVTFPDPLLSFGEYGPVSRFTVYTQPWYKPYPLSTNSFNRCAKRAAGAPSTIS